MKAGAEAYKGNSNIPKMLDILKKDPIVPNYDWGFVRIPRTLPQMQPFTYFLDNRGFAVLGDMIPFDEFMVQHNRYGPDLTDSTNRIAHAITVEHTYPSEDWLNKPDPKEPNYFTPSNPLYFAGSNLSRERYDRDDFIVKANNTTYVEKNDCAKVIVQLWNMHERGLFGSSSETEYIRDTRNFTSSLNPYKTFEINRFTNVFMNLILVRNPVKDRYVKLTKILISWLDDHFSECGFKTYPVSFNIYTLSRLLMSSTSNLILALMLARFCNIGLKEILSERCEECACTAISTFAEGFGTITSICEMFVAYLRHKEGKCRRHSSITYPNIMTLRDEVRSRFFDVRADPYSSPDLDLIPIDITSTFQMETESGVNDISSGNILLEKEVELNEYMHFDKEAVDYGDASESFLMRMLEFQEYLAFHYSSVKIKRKQVVIDLMREKGPFIKGDILPSLSSTIAFMTTELKWEELMDLKCSKCKFNIIAENHAKLESLNYAQSFTSALVGSSKSFCIVCYEELFISDDHMFPFFVDKVEANMKMSGDDGLSYFKTERNNLINELKYVNLLKSKSYHSDIDIRQIQFLNLGDKQNKRFMNNPIETHHRVIAMNKYKARNHDIKNLECTICGQNISKSLLTQRSRVKLTVKVNPYIVLYCFRHLTEYKESFSGRSKPMVDEIMKWEMSKKGLDDFPVVQKEKGIQYQQRRKRQRTKKPP